MSDCGLAGSTGDREIVEFYRLLNLDCQLSLNSFLQTRDNRQEWFDEYYINANPNISHNIGSICPQ